MQSFNLLALKLRPCIADRENVILRGLRGHPPRSPRSSADMCFLGCQKIIEGSIFWGRDWSQKLLSDLDLGGPGDLRSDLRGHPRPKIAKFVILASLKDDHFFILQGPTWGRSRPRPPRSFEEATSIWPPRPFEAVRGQNRFFAEIFKLWIDQCSQSFAIRFSTILSSQEYVFYNDICQ